jgi:chemotaxis methyl-accepting protein methylase
VVKLVTYLVRVTTNDRSHRLWAAAACSGEEAFTLILNAVPES